MQKTLHHRSQQVITEWNQLEQRMLSGLIGPFQDKRCLYLMELLIKQFEGQALRCNLKLKPGQKYKIFFFDPINLN
jgi:hypothetical protein